MVLLTINEAADYLRVSKRTLYNWNCQKKIKVVKLGGLKYKKEDLDYLIEKSKKN